MKNFFELDKLGTNIKTELVAGFSAFIAMSYILILNPKVLSFAGFDFGATYTASILITVFACLFTAFFVKKPFALAPYIGENAFIAYTVISIMGYTWTQALGAIFIVGILLLVLTILNVRQALVKAIPKNLKLAFVVGLGIFLVFIGFKSAGIIEFLPNGGLTVGNLLGKETLIALFGLLVMFVLSAKKIKAAMPIGIITAFILGIIFGDINMPDKIFAAPPSIEPIFLKLDVLGVLNLKSFPLLFTLIILIFTDTMGTLMGLGARANLLDENGNLAEIKKPMLVDSISTIIASLFGTTTTGAYAESVSGIEAGGKSGIVPLVVAFLFFTALFFSPLIEQIPSYAYAGALIMVGMLMITTIKDMDLAEPKDYIPTLSAILVSGLAQNIGLGMSLGFFLYPLCNLVSSEKDKVSPMMWVLATISVIFIIVYPY
ncbi:NCS2 family permease [bacterium]|nr:NCS2 family permease [bacterium]